MNSKFSCTRTSKDLSRSIVLSIFRYCPLAWIFCGKCSNNFIMKIHYRCLRAFYDTKTKTFRDLLCINGKIDIHTQNIQVLMTEIYICLNEISPPFAWDNYNQKSNYHNLRREHLLKLNKCRTKTCGLNTAVFKSEVVSNKLPNQFKEAKSLTEFKTLIYEWTQFSCTCFICS